MLKKLLPIVMTFMLVVPLVTFGVELNATPAYAAPTVRECEDGPGNLTPTAAT